MATQHVNGANHHAHKPPNGGAAKPNTVEATTPPIAFPTVFASPASSAAPSLGARVIVAALATVSGVALRVITKGYTALTLPFAQLQQLLGPILYSQSVAAALADIPTANDPGKQGAMSVREGDVLASILDAADQVPGAFGVQSRGGAFRPWDTAPLRAKLERFLLLRQVGQVGIVELCNRAARVLAAELRTEILARYEIARAMAANNEVLADALAEATQFYGHASQARAETRRADAKAQARAQRTQAAIERTQQRAAQSDLVAKALAAKQEAEAQVKALRSKKKG